MYFGCPDCGCISAAQQCAATIHEHGYFNAYEDFRTEETEVYEIIDKLEYICCDCGNTFNEPVEWCDQCDLLADDCACDDLEEDDDDEDEYVSPTVLKPKKLLKPKIKQIQNPMEQFAKLSTL